MTTYNTGNPVPSGDARDRFDNSQTLDDLINSSAPFSVSRLSKSLKTWAGLQLDFFNMLQNSAWESAFVQYAAGAVVERATQLVQYPAGAGELYRVKNQSTLPLTLTGTWATDAPKLVNVGDATVRQLVQPFISANFYEPQGLDNTGATDLSALVLGYLETYRLVQLPAGVFRLDNLTVPSGCSLVGIGRSPLNRVTKVWTDQATSTTIIGQVQLTGSRGCFISDLNIDAYDIGGNALSGVNDSTRDHWITRVNTRANNHNQLWEANSLDPGMAGSGNIYVEDCCAYDGPNGFVTKMRNVTFHNCKAYDTTIQAFVVVSDNINGPTIRSRAVNTRISNCGGAGNHQGVTVYSRDAHSEDNTYQIEGTQDTYIDVHFTDIGNCSVHVGFYTGGTAGFTRLYNDNVVIVGGNYSAPTPAFHIRFDDAARPRVLGGYFLGANGIVYGDFCVDPVVTDGVKTYGPMTGILAAEKVFTGGETAVNVDSARTRVVFQNTVTTVVSSVVSSNSSRELDIVINDSLTSVVLGSVVISGIGAYAKIAWDSASWKVLNTGNRLPTGEVLIQYALDQAFTWPSMAVRMPLSGNINSLSPNGGALSVGQQLSLKIYNTEGGARSIFNWNGVDFGSIIPVGAIDAGKVVVIRMQWDGAKHLVTSVNTFSS